jgi:hypothetical protein
LNNGDIKKILDILYVPKLFLNLFFDKQFALVRGEINIKGGHYVLTSAKGSIMASCTIENDFYKKRNITNNK